MSKLEAVGYGILAGLAFTLSWLAREKYPYCAASHFLLAMQALTKSLYLLTNDSTLDFLNSEFTRACQYFCIPLIATEICLLAGVQKEYSIGNLAIPAVEYMVSFSGNNEMHFVDISNAASLGLIAYYTYELQRYIGIGIIVGALFTNLVASRVTVVPNYDCDVLPFFGFLVVIASHSFVSDTPVQEMVKLK